MIELIGIIAGIFVLTSFTFKDVKQIRKINIIGCLLFIVYGYLIMSISVIFLNLSTLVINIKHLKNNE